MTGTIKSLRLDKGYGFISRADGADVFFHFRDLNGLEFNEALQERRCQFDLVDGPRGPRAANVRSAD